MPPDDYGDIGRITKRRGMTSERDLQQVLESKIAALVPDDARNWCTPVTVILEGKPYAELITYASDHGMDMVVLGVRGRSLMETLLLGSNTDRVIRQACCPTLAVRPVPLAGEGGTNG